MYYILLLKAIPSVQRYDFSKICTTLSNPLGKKKIGGKTKTPYLWTNSNDRMVQEVKQLLTVQRTEPLENFQVSQLVPRARCRTH